MPRYLVPGDLEIRPTNKEKKNYNGCNGLAGSERALKWDRVPPLQCNGHLLEQVGGLSLVACDVCRPSSDLLDQFDGLMMPGRFRPLRLLLLLLLIADFVSGAATWRTRRNIRVVFDSDPFAPLWNMTSFTKPEVHNILHLRQRRTRSENLVKFGHMFFEVCERTETQTDRQTYRHAYRNVILYFVHVPWVKVTMRIIKIASNLD